MRFWKWKNFIWVHHITLNFWVHYSTWVFKKYGPLNQGFSPVMCFDGPIFYFSFWKSDVVWWTQKTDVIWWTLILIWFDGPFGSIKPHLCQKFSFRFKIMSGIKYRIQPHKCACSIICHVLLLHRILKVQSKYISGCRPTNVWFIIAKIFQLWCFKLLRISTLYLTTFPKVPCSLIIIKVLSSKFNNP